MPKKKSRQALCLVRSLPHYRLDAFTKALEINGFRVICDHRNYTMREGDLLVTWNRYGTGDRMADMFQRAGNPVIVAENSYVNMRGTKKAFALALNHHNGAGIWPFGDGDRLNLLDIEIKPWIDRGKFVLVLPQRGIGPSGVAMPRNWGEHMQSKIKTRCRMPVKLRRHPGNQKNPPALETDLRKAHCGVTWGSGAGIKALIAGVPVFYEFKNWIAGSAACFTIKEINHERPSELMGDRVKMLKRLAWAQWTVQELMSGTPIRFLLETHRDDIRSQLKLQERQKK